jgi:hypothetical protein
MQRFVGQNHGTIVSIVTDAPQKVCAFFGHDCHTVVDATPIYSMDGDGTVPLNSAAPPGAPSSVQTLYFNDPNLDHMGMAKNLVSQALEFIQQTQATAAVSRSADTQAVGSTTPWPTAHGLDLLVSGDVTGYVADAAGDTLGPGTPPGSTSLDDGSYDAIRDTQSFFLDDPGTYTGTFSVNATGDGYPVTLRVLHVSHAVDQVATFYVPAAPAGAVLQVTADPAADLGSVQLRVDANHDGTFEQTLAPVSVSSGAGLTTDTTPPTTFAGSTISGLDRATVTLQAQDDPGGSGVAATYYLPDGATQPVQYTHPFTVPLNSTVEFMSVDAAGNAESLESIVADDAPSSRQTAETLSPTTVLARTIWPVGDEDWFTFVADGSSRYQALLTDLLHGCSISLYDSTGQLVQSGSRIDLLTDRVGGVLAAGRYYVRITGNPGPFALPRLYALALVRTRR